MSQTNVLVNPFKLRDPKKQIEKPEEHWYKYKGDQIVCITENRGHAHPKNMGRTELWLDSPGGIVPLWAEGVTLKWRFNENSMKQFDEPSKAKEKIQALLTEALKRWDDSVPVRFSHSDKVWDFEIYARKSDECDINGCVLASSFFPDAGKHKLTVFPKMLEQSEEEQVLTLVHELGHTFGLRHWFANLSEKEWPSEAFGSNKDKFSIMNYGDESQLTERDKSDLKALYTTAWSGKLKKLNKTPIQFVKPFSMQ